MSEKHLNMLRQLVTLEISEELLRLKEMPKRPMTYINELEELKRVLDEKV